jgi:aryl-alcohol dehydrogenase-like predicted oxidoreductase
MAAVSAEKMGVGPVLGENMVEFPAIQVRPDVDATDVVSLWDAAMNPLNMARKLAGKTRVEGTAAYQIPRIRRAQAALAATEANGMIQGSANLLGSFLEGALAPVVRSGGRPAVAFGLDAGIYPTPSGEEY